MAQIIKVKSLIVNQKTSQKQKTSHKHKRKGVKDVTKLALLDEMQKQSRIKEVHRERASQILNAVEGMRIWEARELMEQCIGALQRLDVCYSESRDDTTS